MNLKEFEKVRKYFLPESNYVIKEEVDTFGRAFVLQRLGILQKSEFLKLNVLIFHVKELNTYCESDRRVIASNF